MDFFKGLKIVTHVRVVNDTDEVGVKLIQNYNASLTKNEQMQQVLQTFLYKDGDFVY